MIEMISAFKSIFVIQISGDYSPSSHNTKVAH